MPKDPTQPISNINPLELIFVQDLYWHVSVKNTILLRKLGFEQHNLDHYSHNPHNSGERIFNHLLRTNGREKIDLFMQFFRHDAPLWVAVNGQFFGGSAYFNEGIQGVDLFTWHDDSNVISSDELYSLLRESVENFNETYNSSHHDRHTAQLTLYDNGDQVIESSDTHLPLLSEKVFYRD